MANEIERAKSLLGSLGKYRDGMSHDEIIESLVDISTRDSMTGLYNKEKFQREYSKFVKLKTINEGMRACLVVIDIDHFKKINDSRGHVYGDTVIMQLASLLKNNLKDIDVKL